MTETERSHDKLWRYSVTAVIHDVSRVNDYLDWLLDGHVADVCQWASDAEVVHLSTGDDHVPSNRVMSVYWFNTQADFHRYEREGAPSLRRDGIEFTAAIGGVTFERDVGWSYRIG